MKYELSILYSNPKLNLVSSRDWKLKIWTVEDSWRKYHKKWNSAHSLTMEISLSSVGMTQPAGSTATWAMSRLINVCVVGPDMSVMFCACYADKGDLLKLKLALVLHQWLFYGFVVNKNSNFLSQDDFLARFISANEPVIAYMI